MLSSYIANMTVKPTRKPTAGYFSTPDDPSGGYHICRLPNELPGIGTQTSELRWTFDGRDDIYISPVRPDRNIRDLI